VAGKTAWTTRPAPPYGALPPVPGGGDGLGRWSRDRRWLLVGAEDSSSSSLNEQPDESPRWGSRNEEEAMSMNECVAATTAWVLVNQPDIIRYAKELVGALPVFGLVSA